MCGKTFVSEAAANTVRRGGCWWALPANDQAPGEEPGETAAGGLGFATVLAPADIDGAVVGTTAVLGGSYLAEDGAGPGAHLFAAVAHQFAVEELGLKPGMAATAVVKSTSVMVEA